MIKAPTYNSIENIPLLKSSANKRYPTAVLFILGSKVFEAFAANGIRTILVLYLRDDLNFTESSSTVMLHIFNFFSQFTPIFGAIIADSALGNIQTIFYFCILYALGWYGIILTSFQSDQLPTLFMVSLSLLLISVGNGSIRACLASLGAQQFRLPEQLKLLTDYFSYFYFFYYIGIFLSKILPPMIRSETSCFGKTGCYPIVFGTLGSVFMLSWIVFIFGKIYYRREDIGDENVVLKFFKCICHALSVKMKRWNVNKEHWIHHAEDKYPCDFMDQVHVVLKVTKLFLPIPIYYALLAQQDSSWTFQATQMNRNIFGFTIEADQAKAMGPIFLFSMIPIYKFVVCPLLKQCHIEIDALKSMQIGAVLAACSFLCSGVLQLEIDRSTALSISILWQVPQFLLLMAGELLLSIPGLEFAFKEAPTSMKSVVTAIFFLNNAFGNLIVVILTEMALFKSQSLAYFMYAGLMFIGTFQFMVFVRSYVREPVKSKDDTYVEIGTLPLSRASSIGEFIL